MILSYVLLAIGLGLIFLEFFLPGAILGITGGILILISVVLFAIYIKSAIWTIVYIAIAIILVVTLMKITVWRIRKSKPGGGIYLNHDQEGYVASNYQKELIGKIGMTVSDLKPSGHVLIDGQMHQALSKVGYIEKNEQITVVGGEGAHLIVMHINTSPYAEK